MQAHASLCTFHFMRGITLHIKYIVALSIVIISDKIFEENSKVIGSDSLLDFQENIKVRNIAHTYKLIPFGGCYREIQFRNHSPTSSAHDKQNKVLESLECQQGDHNTIGSHSQVDDNSSYLII